MAETILRNDYIQEKKGFLSLSTTYIYVPTGSKMKAEQKGFDMNGGKQVRMMLDGDIESLKNELTRKGLPRTSNNANTLLNLFYSEDHQFVAMQLEQFKDFSYQPVTEVITATGADARQILSALGI